MQIVLYILIAFVFFMLAVSMLLMLVRIWTARDKDERERYMAEVAARHDGEVTRTGLLGHDTVNFSHGDVTGRIMLVTNVSQSQTRYLTYITFKRPAPFISVGARTAGASPPPSFSHSLPSQINVNPLDMPPVLKFYASDIDGARWINIDRTFSSFIRKLAAMAGLAKFEIFQHENDFKFAIDGFLLDEKQLMALYDLLLDYVKNNG